MKPVSIRLRLAALAVVFAQLSLCAAQEEPRTTLQVTSHPEGAAVFVDAVNRGVTPLSVTGLPAGQHLVQTEKDGFEPAFETVTLAESETKVVPFNLRPQNGILLLISDPAGCDVRENGISLGQTPLLTTALASGEHRLSVSAAGYLPKEIRVTLNGRIPLRQTVQLQSDSGTLDVTSQPSGAEVRVNGIARGKTPCRVTRIPGGKATVELVAEGFQRYSHDISLSPGEVQALNASLSPLPGTLQIVSIPDGGRVYLEDEYKGTTPCSFSNLKPGTYHIRVDRAGCDSVARDVTLANGASLTEEFRLVTNTGRIEVFTVPAGATILLNGKKWGLTISKKNDLTTISDAFMLSDVKEGEYELEIVKKGYAQQRRKVTVTRDKTVTVQVPLKRLFIPDYEVTTSRSHYKGVLEFVSDEGIRIEISPGISQTIPMTEIKKHGYLKATE
ncbi:MAG: PEGA domain-containing protein [Kiritimatiellae bacterium]|nr:PEGA domain-containing protein [Kiritimatiellia bacterium]